jgi:TPR repeat protein
MKRFLKLLLAVAASSAGVAGAQPGAREMEQAMQFYQSGYYVHAADRFRAAARAGNARAAEALGVMYALGSEVYPGVPRDARTASHWLDIAARGGQPVSRYMVCALRRNGAPDHNGEQCFDWVAETGKPGPQ